MKKFILLPLTALMIFASSCNDDETTDVDPAGDVDPVEESQTATLRLRMEHVFNGEPLNLDEDFITEDGDTIEVEELKYFLSNISFADNEGNEMYVKDSYHLMELGEESHITIRDIEGLEPGIFTSFNVSVGVDEEANHTVENARGDLSPAGSDGMIWTWRTGYKFIKFEGHYHENGEEEDFLYHLGTDQNFKTFNFNGILSEEQEGVSSARVAHSEGEDEEGELFISVEANKVTEIHLMVDVSELFKSPTSVDISTMNNIAGGNPAESVALMDNIEYSDYPGRNGWFELHHVITFEE